MNKDLAKDLDAIAKEVAEKHGTTIVVPEFLIQLSLIQVKLSILGSNAKDRKIDVKDTCTKLGVEVANLMNIFVKLEPALAADKMKCIALQKDVDSLLQPVIMFHYMGIGEGRKPS